VGRLRSAWQRLRELDLPQALKKALWNGFREVHSTHQGFVSNIWHMQLYNYRVNALVRVAQAGQGTSRACSNSKGALRMSMLHIVIHC
jgi:hypothetical protein